MEKGQMKKGVLEMCMLHIISRGDMYGYEIMKEVTGAFSGINESTVYAVLRRLHSDNFTECYFGDTSAGPRRKYYRITPLGREALKGMQKEWDETLGAVDSIIK